MKKLSIVIPVYNRPSIKYALDSIIRSDEVEILVIDGKSNHETLEVIEKYMDRIDYFISEKDKGLYDAMNKGVAAASGEWIFTLATDDRLICNPLDIIKKYENEDADLICGNLLAEKNSGRYIVLRSSTELSKLELDCTLWHPGTFFRKTAYEKYGVYELDYKIAGDHELFLRYLKRGAKIKVIPEIVTLFSLDGVSSSSFINALKEDVKVADAYNVSFFRSRLNFVKRAFLSEGHHIKDVLGLAHKTQGLDKEELKKVLAEHSEIIESFF